MDTKIEDTLARSELYELLERLEAQRNEWRRDLDRREEALREERERLEQLNTVICETNDKLFG